MIKILTALLFLFSISACEAAERNPIGERYPLTITTQTGENHALQVEIRGSSNEKALGLMHRKEMDDNHGMLFLYEEPHNLSFWMKNTYIPLDIIFIGADNRIVHIHENAIPHDTTPIRSGALANKVLEVNGGLAKELRITVGDVVKY